MSKYLFSFVVLFATTTTFAQAPDNLSWKFSDGQTFYMTEVMEQKQTVTTSTNVENKNTTQTTITKFDILEARKDGGVKLVMAMVSVKEDPPSPNTRFILDRMQGAKFTVELDGAGAIKSFGGYEDFVSRIANGNAQMAKTFRSILSEKSFRLMVTQTFSIVPGRPVKQGEVWKQNQLMTLGPFGNVAIVRNIKHSGAVKSRDGREYVKLDLKGDARYQPPQEEFTNLPFRILEGNLDFDGISGQGYFDAITGRLAQLKVNMSMSGVLKIQAAGTEESVKLKQTQTGTVKISSTNPLEAASGSAAKK